jgi:hypothetical protein
MIDKICIHYSSRMDDPIQETAHVFQFTNTADTKYSIGYPKEFLLHFVRYFEQLVREDSSGVSEHFRIHLSAEKQGQVYPNLADPNYTEQQTSVGYHLTPDQIRQNLLSCFKAATILTLWPNNNGCLTMNIGSEFQCFIMSLANNYLVYVQLQLDNWSVSDNKINDEHLPMLTHVLQIHLYLMQILVNSVSIEGMTIDDYLPMQPWSFSELTNISTGNFRITNKLDVKKNLHILKNLYTNHQMITLKLEYFNVFVKEDCWSYVFGILNYISKIIKNFIPKGELSSPEISNLKNLLLIIEAEALNLIAVTIVAAPSCIPSNINSKLMLSEYLSIVVSLKCKHKSITEALIIRICFIVLRMNSLFASLNLEQIAGTNSSNLALQPKDIAYIFIWLHKQFDYLGEDFSWISPGVPASSLASKEVPVDEYNWLIFSVNYKRQSGKVANRHDLWPWKTDENSAPIMMNSSLMAPTSSSFHILEKDVEKNLVNLMKNLQQYWIWDAVISEVLGSQLLSTNRPQSSGLNIKINAKRIRYVFQSFYEMFRDSSFHECHSAVAFENVSWVPLAQLKFVHFISQVFKAAEATDIFAILNEYETFRLLLGEKFLMANCQLPVKLDDYFNEIIINPESSQTGSNNNSSVFCFKGVKQVKYISQFIWFLLHDRVMDYFHGLVIYSLYFQTSSSDSQIYLGYEDIMLVLTQYSLSVARSTPASCGYLVYRIGKLMINLYEIVCSMAVNGSKDSRDKIIIQLLETVENLMITKSIGEFSSLPSAESTNMLVAASSSISELLITIVMPMGSTMAGCDWIDLFLNDDRMVNVDVSAEVQQKYLIMRKNLGKFRGTPSASSRPTSDGRSTNEKADPSGKDRALKLRSTLYPLLLMILDENLYLTSLQIIQYIIVVSAEAILALDIEDIKAGEHLNRRKKQSYRSLGAEVVNLIFSFLSVSHKHPNPSFSVAVLKAGLNSLLYLLRSEELVHIRIHIQEFIRRENLLYEFLKSFARSLYGFDSKPKSSSVTSNLTSLIATELNQQSSSTRQTSNAVLPQVEILRLGLAFLTSVVAGNDASKNELRLLLQTSKEKLVSGRVRFATTLSDSSSRSMMSKATSKLTSLILCAEKQPAKDTIVVLLDLILEGPLAGEEFTSLVTPNEVLFMTDADRPKIRNTSVLQDFFQLIPSCTLEVQQFAIRSFVNLIRGRASLINQNVCSAARPKVIDIALDMMEVISEQMQTPTAELIELLGRHSISVASLKHLFRKLQTDTGGRPRYAWKVIQALQGMFHQDPGPRHTFVFDGFASGLRLPLIYRWPTLKGFSFCCWIRVESPRNNVTRGDSATLTVNPQPKNYFPYVLCLRDNNNNGLELFLSPTQEENKYKIVLRYTSDSGESSNLSPESSKLKMNEGQWYFLAISLTPNSFYSKGEAMIKLNGFSVKSEFNFNKLPDNIPEPTIGDSGTHNQKDYANNTLRGQLGAMYFFNEAISEKQLSDVNTLGPDYVYNFEPFSADYKDISLSTSNNKFSVLTPGSTPTFSILENGILTSKILLAYNPVVLRGKYFLDNTPERNEIKWRVPLHLELSDEIKGESTKYCNMHAIRLPGTYRSTTQDVRLAINSLGGIRAIIPLFAQIDQVVNQPQSQLQLQLQGSTTAAPSSSLQPLITEYDPNFFPAVLGLFTTMVEENPENIIIFSNVGGFSAVRSLLDKASSQNFNLITFNQLIALYSRLGVELTLQESCMENILCNFKLWYQSPLEVQMTLFDWLIETFETNYLKFSSLLCSQRFIDAFFQYYDYTSPNLNITSNSLNASTSSASLPGLGGNTPVTPAFANMTKQNTADPSSNNPDENNPLIASSPRTASLANLLMQTNQTSHLSFEDLKLIRSKLLHLIKLSIKNHPNKEYEDIVCLLKYLSITTNPIAQQEVLLLIVNLLQTTGHLVKRQTILLGLLYGNFFPLLEILYYNSCTNFSSSPSHSVASMTTETTHKAVILWTISNLLFYLQLDKKSLIPLSAEFHQKFSVATPSNNNNKSTSIEEVLTQQQQVGISDTNSNSSTGTPLTSVNALNLQVNVSNNVVLDFQPTIIFETDFQTGNGCFNGFNSLINTILASSEDIISEAFSNKASINSGLNVLHIIFSLLIGKIDIGLKDLMIKRFPNMGSSSGSSKYSFSIAGFENIQDQSLKFFFDNSNSFGSIEDKALVFANLVELPFPSLYLPLLSHLVSYTKLKEDTKQEMLDDLFTILFPKVCEQIFSFPQWFEVFGKSLNTAFKNYVIAVSSMQTTSSVARKSLDQAPPEIVKLQREYLRIAVTASKLLRITCFLVSMSIKLGKASYLPNLKTSKSASTKERAASAQQQKIEYSKETKTITPKCQNDLFASIVREERGYGSTLIKELIHSVELHVQDASIKFYIIVNILIVALVSLKELAQRFYSAEYSEEQLANFMLVKNKNLWILGMTMMELFDKLKSLTEEPTADYSKNENNNMSWLENLFLVMNDTIENEDENNDNYKYPSPGSTPPSASFLLPPPTSSPISRKKAFPYWFIRFNQFLFIKIFYFNALNDSILYIIKNYLDFFYLNHIDYANLFSNYHLNQFSFDKLENKFKLELCFQNVTTTKDFSKLVSMESNNEFIIGNNLWLSFRILLKYIVQFHTLLNNLPNSHYLPSTTLMSTPGNPSLSSLSASHQDNISFLISLFLLSHNLLKKTIAKNSKLYIFESMFYITVVCKILVTTGETKKMELLTVMLAEYIKNTYKEYNAFLEIYSQLSGHLLQENSFRTISSAYPSEDTLLINSYKKLEDSPEQEFTGRTKSISNANPNLLMLQTQNLDGRLDLISKIFSGMLTSSQIEGFLRYHHVDHQEYSKPSVHNILVILNALECNGVVFPITELTSPTHGMENNSSTNASSSSALDIVNSKKYFLWDLLIHYIHEFGSYMEEELLLVKMMELGLKDQLLTMEGMKDPLILQAPPVFNRPHKGSSIASYNSLETPSAVTRNISSSLNYDLIAFISLSESRRLFELMKQFEYNIRRSEKRWIRIFSQLANERGPWGYAAESRRREVYWTLDSTENDLHLKMKLKRNPFGTRHALATMKSEGKDSFVEESNINNDRLLLSDLKKYKKSKSDSNALLMDEDDEKEMKTTGAGSDNEDENAEDTTTMDLTANTTTSMFDTESITVVTEVITSGTNSSGGKTIGKLECTRSKLIFSRQNENKDFDFVNKTGNNEFLWAVECCPNTTWPSAEICGVYRRHYQLRYVGLEIFFVNRTSIFFNLIEKKNAKKIYRFMTMKMKTPNLNNVYMGRPKEAINKIDPQFGLTLTQAWVARKISNFDYLLFLNFIAGRTFNDLAQYPVFPWVLSDYNSTKLDLKDPNIYRKFERPIGAQTDSQRNLMIEKYESCLQLLDDGIFPYHTGSHYSTSAMVIWYLIRMEPFTSYHVWLQDGKFDRPDRLFYSIQHTYTGCISNSQDVKELIPEFFFNPEFLYNVNNCSFGSRQQTNDEIGDVVLPLWARDASEFVRVHREALESEYVSQNLHHWIDLIFGCRQRPPFLSGGSDKAVESCNVFVHLSYLDAVDLEAMKASDPTLYNRTIRQIDSYGQTPIQLFSKEHPKRKSLEELHDLIWPIASVVLGAETKPRETMVSAKSPTSPEDLVLDKPAKILCYNEFKIANSPVVFIAEILQLEKLITVDTSRVLGYHTFQRRQPDNVPPYVFKLDRIAMQSSSGGQSMKQSSKPTVTSFLSAYSTNQREKVIGIPFAASVVLASSIIDRPASLDNEIENLIGTRQNKMKYHEEEAKLRGMKRANEISIRMAKTPVKMNSNAPSDPTTPGGGQSSSTAMRPHSGIRRAPNEYMSDITGLDRSMASPGMGALSILNPGDVVIGENNNSMTPGNASGNNNNNNNNSSNKDNLAGRSQRIDEHIGPHLFSFLTCTVTITSIPSVTKTFQYIFSCGHWDNTFKITLADTGRLVQSLSYHREVVTCITSVSDFGKYWVIVGSKDCTITVWELFPERESEPVNASPILTLYGHDDAINCIAANAELDIIASGSDDGTIIIHTLKDGTYLRSITFGKLTVNPVPPPPPDNNPSRPGSTKATDTANANATVVPATNTPNHSHFSPQQLDKDNYRVHMLVISKEGQIVAYSHDGYMLATYTINGRYQRMISVREKLYTLCLSEDGRVVLTGGERGLILLRWVHNLMIANSGPRKGLDSIIDGSNESDYEPFPSAIRSMALTAGEQHLIVGLESGEMRILAQVKIRKWIFVLFELCVMNTSFLFC